MGAGECHMIGTSVFGQFCGALRRYQCSIFVQFCKALRTVLLKGEGNVTYLILTSMHSIYMMYIYCNNHVAELKAKAPPLLVMLCFGFKLSPMVYRGMRHILMLVIM